MVIVDGLDELGHVRIRDPWQGTSYRMIVDDFLEFWIEEGVFWRKS